MSVSSALPTSRSDLPQAAFGSNLLCAVDHSDRAVEVADFATRLAARLGIRARLVETSHRLDVLRAMVEDDTGLVVTAAHHRGPLRSALSASPPAALARSLARPVIVVPHEADTTLDDEPVVVAGIDGSPASLDALDLAARAAAAMHGRVVAVHARSIPVTSPPPIAWDPMAWTPPPPPPQPETSPDVLADALSHLDVDVPVAVRGEFADPAELLSRIAREQSAVLVAVGRRGLGRFGSALAGSVSSQLAESSPVPVLIVPENEG